MILCLVAVLVNLCNLFSNSSTHVFVIIIKSQEKIKPVKWYFQYFNLNGQILQNVRIKILCKLPAVCSIDIDFSSAQAYILMILCKLTVQLINILFSIAFH